MQELTATDIDQVAGGISIYCSPPPPNSTINLGDIQTRAPGSYDDPTPWEWNV